MLIGAIAAIKDSITSVVGVDTLVSTGALELIHSAVVDASLLVCSIHTVPVPITDIVGVYAAVVWTLKLPWVTCAPQVAVGFI